jgi:uncharacterized protein
LFSARGKPLKLKRFVKSRCVACSLVETERLRRGFRVQVLKSSTGVRMLVGLMKWFALILAAMIFGGCQKTSPPPVATTPGMPPLPTQAQAKLPTIKLWMGSEEVSAEMALTGEQQMTGMMFRTNMEENAGMLFVFPGPFRASFWMKNCPLPLSAAYIDPNGTILEIVPLNSFDTNSVVAKSADVQYVLEMNQGWFKRHHIEEGMLIRTERGTLRETFFGR